MSKWDGLSIITLTTDFGRSDWFVGAMKLTILEIYPTARLVDLSHELNAGDIHGGAFVLAMAWRIAPPGSVHIAVVDPGVGGQRKAIAARAGGHFFVGPDNGILTWALREETVEAVHEITNPDCLASEISLTFHGRNIFAPAAAHLAAGEPIETLGPSVQTMQSLHFPRPVLAKGEFIGEVLLVDRFGNAITNVDRTALGEVEPTSLEAVLGNGRTIPVRLTYSSAPIGEMTALMGSTDFLEIAVNGGSANTELGLCRGDEIVFRNASVDG